MLTLWFTSCGPYNSFLIRETFEPVVLIILISRRTALCFTQETCLLSIVPAPLSSLSCANVALLLNWNFLPVFIVKPFFFSSSGKPLFMIHPRFRLDRLFSESYYLSSRGGDVEKKNVWEWGIILKDWVITQDLATLDCQDKVFFLAISVLSGTWA